MLHHHKMTLCPVFVVKLNTTIHRKTRTHSASRKGHPLHLISMVDDHCPPTTRQAVGCPVQEIHRRYQVNQHQTEAFEHLQGPTTGGAADGLTAQTHNGFDRLKSKGSHRLQGLGPLQRSLANIEIDQVQGLPHHSHLAPTIQTILENSW